VNIVGIAVEPVKYRHGAFTEVVKNDLQRGFGDGILKQEGFGVDSQNLDAGEYEYHVTAPAGGQSVPKVQAQALEQDLIDRIQSSVLCVSNTDGDVIATAIVWDYTADHVLLLTNYHTWDEDEFRYCFPPPDKKKKRKRGDDEVEHLKLRNEDGFGHNFQLTADLFHSWEKDEDFAILKLPKAGFTMPRIPISLGISLTLRIHAFGYIGYSKQFNINGGEVAGFIAEGFTMNLLSAGGFSGAAIIADGRGRCVGYMGGNLDASKDKNSQHQSYGFRFDRVILATKRETTPTNSPAGKAGSSSNNI